MAGKGRMIDMEVAEIARRLKLFGIPHEDTQGVRGVLARLVAAQSLSLGELQTARDIVNRKECKSEAVYLFLAAMFISQSGGNAFLRPEKGAALLEKAGYLEDAADEIISNAEHAETVRALWKKAQAAAEELDGDVVVKRSYAGGEGWFFKRNLSAVEAVSKALAKHAADGKAARSLAADNPLSSDELDAAIKFRGIKLNNEQIEAVKRVAQNRFVVVTGGPGTGKTTVVCAMLRVLMARGLDLDEIALAAPTGRAAQRMGEALRNQCAKAEGLGEETRRKIESLDGSTIHSLLGGFPPNWKYTEENKLPLKLVVVDESSMVDVHIMKALVAALPDDCRLVLLGDKDQLPSVETGAVLGDIVGTQDAEFVVRLTVSNRFPEDFAKCAIAVNEGKAEDFANVSPELSWGNIEWLNSFDSAETRCFRCVFPENSNSSACHDLLMKWAEHYGLLEDGRLVNLASDSILKDDAALTEGTLSEKAKAIFAELDRSRILTVVRKGPHGVDGVNELLLKARFGGRLPFNPLVKAGVPVIITRNTPSKRLWNGDVGVTVEGRSGMVVMFPRGDKVVSCPVGLLPEHELAYAMTVHKSQGSEFENVMVVLPDDKEHPLLNRQIVYTGITRAKKRAVIVGTGGTLNAALSRKIERDTGIALGGDCACHRMLSSDM